MCLLLLSSINIVLLVIMLYPVQIYSSVYIDGDRNP